LVALLFTIFPFLGENGLGKTGFINHVLGQPIFQDNQQQQQQQQEEEKPIADKVKIRVRSQEIEEAGSRAHISVIDLPNFGGKHDKKEAGKAALAYIQDQFETILREESQLRRQQKDSRDTRIHSVLYFHNPTAHKLSNLDIELISKMSKLANVLVLIAKGDTLLRHEYLRIKNNMREQLAEAGVKTFLGSEEVNQIFEPFICVSGADLLAPSPARNYTWGSLKVNPSASPASLNINGLTNLLFKDYLPDLILDTQAKYETWKAEIVSKTDVKDEEWKEPAEVLKKIVAKLNELKINA
jgi:cell division control protein 11